MLRLHTILLLITGLGLLIGNKIGYGKWTLLHGLNWEGKYSKGNILREIPLCITSAALPLGIVSLISDCLLLILALVAPNR